MNQIDNMKNVSNSKENNLQADVVIVGTGVGGCFSALNLSEDLSIIMITKSDLESSDSFLAQGGICVLHDDDDYDSYFEDTMRAGHYENRKESVDIMIRGSQDVIHDLIGYGVDENIQVIRLHEDAETHLVLAEPMEPMNGWDVNTILEDYMDTEVYNRKTTELLEQINVYLNEKAYDEAEKLVNKLAWMTSEENTKVVRARILIAKGR